jgi:hypothetical protein
LWSEHVLPFFSDNWPMLTGIAMVVAGASVLAYYTWDKHWAVRYTILPALLGVFTGALARAGRWLESRESKLKATADLLRGAAMALLPANFMAVALLAKDPEVPHKEFLLPGAALLYLAFFGTRLRSWSAAVAPGLESVLGHALLALNALVLVGPAARQFGTDDAAVRLILGAGFHAGFFLAAAAVARFLRSGVGEGRAPWFFGVTLVSTYFQVFLWVHGYMRLLPAVHTYACLMVAAGGLVLLAERTSLAGKAEGRGYGRPSFLGYAFMLLGIFLGASQPQVRMATLALAGSVWLWEARARQEVLGAWIGLTLLALSAGSWGTWDSFPRERIPALALGIALALGAAAPLLSGFWSELRGVATRMQGAALTITTILTVLVQWNTNSSPERAGAILLSAAALFAFRAAADGSLRHVHSAAAVLAISLPYLGLADMSGRTLRGNNLILGLGALSSAWLALLRFRPRPLLLQARSTIPLLYGALGVAALFLRVSFEQGRPDDLLTAPAALSLAGPWLMAGSLLVAAYHSRSLLPIAMAAGIGTILFPQLRREIEQLLPWVTWGSGLGSAVWAAGLAAVCFPLRDAAFLKDLDEGDLFAGREPFPLKRRDHTLFTGPLLACAFFLAAKVDAWNFPANWSGAGVHLKTAAALVVAGLAWTLIAVYLRRKTDARLLGMLGWASAAAGVAFLYETLSPAPVWHEKAFVVVAFLDGLFLLYRDVLAARGGWAEDLLAAPLRRALFLGSAFLWAAVTFSLFGRNAAYLSDIAPLLALSSGQLAWFALSDASVAHGALLYVQTHAAILAWAPRGEARVPVLLYLLAIQGAHLILEQAPERRERGKGLAEPFLFLGSLAALFIGAGGIFELLSGRSIPAAEHALLVAAAALAARAQGCGPLALVAAVLAYLAFLAPAARADLLHVPWRTALFAAALSAAATLGGELRARALALMEGPFAQRFFRSPGRVWVHGAALGLALYAAAGASGASGWEQWAADDLAAAAFVLAGLSWGASWLYGAAAVLATLGNVHAVGFYAGDALRARGLMESHLVSLGVSATLLQTTLLRLVLPEGARVLLNRVALAAAGLVLTLLLGNYFADPNLEVMTAARFLASGAMSLLAARYFRRAALFPDPGEAPHAAAWQGLYHLGVTTAIWCAAMIFPVFRNPYAAFPALCLPALYFYLRAELGGQASYRNTAGTLCFFLLFLYAFRAPFQLVLFPGAPLGSWHYHFNAPFVMAIALMMLRLAGLGGTEWLAFYAGPAMITGSYFTLTRLPGLSPFEFPEPSAWCGIALGHFWMLVCSQPNPIRAFLQDLGEIQGESWERMRAKWGLLLLAATQLSMAWGLFDPAADPRTFAPLLAGGASLLAHQGFIRKDPRFYVLAALEALVALHADFLLPSYLRKDDVVWALITIWALILHFSPPRAGTISAAAAVLVFGHVLYHGPETRAGLSAFALGTLLSALTPRTSRVPESDKERLAVIALLAAPVWLAHFGADGQPYPRQTLVTAAAVLALAWLARWVHERFFAVYSRWERPAPVTLDHAVAVLGHEGPALSFAGLCAAFALTAATQCRHYGRPFAKPDLWLMLGLYGFSAAGWYREGLALRTIPPYIFLQLCVTGFFAVLRRQLMLTLGWWNYEYDVWAALIVSYSMAGAKSLFPLSPPEQRVPLLGTLLLMPVAVMLWVVVHGLGTNTVLLVIGLYSLMFAYMGRDDRESPYHLVSVGGFVAFVLIVFWSKLELRAAQAYVIPVGLGILTLLQLFRDKIAPDTRNEIRAVTLLAMLSSAGYYALMDDRYPIAFHLTLLLVGVGAMALGSFLRIRLYLLLGFTGVLTDLLAMVYKVMLHMDRSARMTVIGGQVLFLGAALICGAVAYKTHREEIDAFLARWRARLGAWE